MVDCIVTQAICSSLFAQAFQSINYPILQEIVMEQADDPSCLATIKHYRSLMPMAQEHRKPIFNLTSADGAIGSHANAVQDGKKDFKLLAEKIANKIGIVV